MRNLLTLILLALTTLCSCSLTSPERFRVSVRPGISKTKYHLRQDAPGVRGTDFFPEDIGSLTNNSGGRIRGSFDLRDFFPMPSEIYIDYAKVDAHQSARLDPASTWIWDGAPVTTLASDVSFDRTVLGWKGHSYLTDWCAISYGLGLRRFLFDGDIVTNANENSFDLEAYWLSPEVGVNLYLPWELEANMSYAGFMQGSLSTGDEVQRPYTASVELRRNFGRFGFAVGYELDHVEFERSLGPEIEFAHLRLRSTYLAIELDF